MGHRWTHINSWPMLPIKKVRWPIQRTDPRPGDPFRAVVVIASDIMLYGTLQQRSTTLMTTCRHYQDYALKAWKLQTRSSCYAYTHTHLWTLPPYINLIVSYRYRHLVVAYQQCDKAAQSVRGAHAMNASYSSLTRSVAGWILISSDSDKQWLV